MEGALKACCGGGAKKGLIVDEGLRNRRRWDGQSCRKIKQQANNYKEITSKYKTNTEQKEQQDKTKLQENKSKTGKSKYKQRKQLEGCPGTSWPKITERGAGGSLTRWGRV